ncbi:MAG TPA: hypothetical protein PKE40_06205 [Arachnia sp.]|nr:hypothetical protein [Arachnia sp.]HMT85929.1 hypothetical protein [Arachnia sp.]
MSKEIATLPPIEVLAPGTPTSPRTGEPPRPVALWVSSILLHLASAALAGAYARHWWQAAHAETYGSSARLIGWLEPDPGKWLSLLLEGVFALALVLAAGACSVIGHQSWRGQRWTRPASVAAPIVAAGFVAILNDAALAGFVLAVAGAALLWLPSLTTYYSRWEQLRAAGPGGYRTPESIHYGRLARFHP